MGVPCIVNIYPFYGDDPVKAEGGREGESEHGTRELPSDNKVGLSCEKEGERTMKKERGRGGKRQSVRLTEASRMEQR